MKYLLKIYLRATSKDKAVELSLQCATGIVQIHNLEKYKKAVEEPTDIDFVEGLLHV